MFSRRSFAWSVGFLLCFLSGCGPNQVPTAPTPVSTPPPQSVPPASVVPEPPSPVPAPQPGPALSSFTIAPSRLRGGDAAAGALTLSGPAPAGGLVISLASSDRDVRPPESITIPEGATAGTIQLPSSPPHADTPVRVTASLNGEVRTVDIVLLLPPPVARADAYNLTVGNPLEVRAPGILANDDRRADHDLTAVLVAGPRNGELVLSPGGGFTYRPAPGFIEDRFTYRPMDGTAAGNEATVVLTGIPPIGPPGGTPSSATLVVSVSSLLLANGGGGRSLTVTNNSSVTATNVASNFAGTALAGRVTESGNTCASLAPSASCTLTFTGTADVAETTFPIQGSDTNRVTSAIEVATIAVGTAFRGGIVFVVNGDGVSGKIAATADNNAGILWGGIGTTTNAQSDTNGAGNTTTVITALGNNSGVPYAAQVCDALSVNSGGVSYTDWYLPAKDELSSLFTNRVAVGGFTAGIYWSSTEFTGNSTGDSWAQVFGTGLQGFSGKTNINVVRCIRAF